VGVPEKEKPEVGQYVSDKAGRLWLVALTVFANDRVVCCAVDGVARIKSGHSCLRPEPVMG
jgi:hypothetical protein